VNPHSRTFKDLDTPLSRLGTRALIHPRSSFVYVPAVATKRYEWQEKEHAQFERAEAALALAGRLRFHLTDMLVAFRDEMEQVPAGREMLAQIDACLAAEEPRTPPERFDPGRFALTGINDEEPRIEPAAAQGAVQEPRG
jgi:hypothetical protein